MPRRSTAGLLAVLCSLALVGCYGSIDQLDRDVAEMIAQRQQLALGQEGVSDASVYVPDLTRLDDQYDKQPATNNPAAADLPAQPRAESANPPDINTPRAEPDALKLDLPALLAYAIENAPAYRSEKESLFLETLSLIIERHLWGPRFFNTVSANVSGTPESGDFDTALSLVNDFSVTQRLPYGGTASVSALVNYTNLLQQSSTSFSPGEAQSASINASINLPLLRGSGQVAREDLIQAERDLIYAVRDFERFRRTFFVDISNTYFGLLQQQRSIQNQRLQIEGLQRLAEEQEKLLEAGRIPGFEAADAEAQVLFGQSNLASVLDVYASSLDSLKLTIGMPVPQSLDIVPVEIDVPSPALDPVESIRIGQAVRLDLQTTEDLIDDARRSVAIARDNLQGDLDLTASLDLGTDSSTDVDGLDFELADSDYSVGLAYALPLDRKIEFTQYRSSLISLEQAERSYRVARDLVALEIRDASREIERATLTLELQGRNVILAEQRVGNVKILRRRGEVPPRRLIEAEEDLLDARNSRDEALADLQTSVLNYLLQTGQMRIDAQGRWLAPGGLRSLESADDADGDVDVPRIPAQTPADEE